MEEEKASEKKPKTQRQPKVQMSKVTSVKSAYDKYGRLVERVTMTSIEVPKGTVKHRRQFVENEIIQLVGQRKINRFVGDTLVRIIRNRKQNPRQKVMRYRQTIPFNGAEMNPPTMLQTMKMDIELICVVYKMREELGFDAEQTKKLWAYFKDEANKMIARHPTEALQIEACRMFDEWRKSMIASQKKREANE